MIRAIVFDFDGVLVESLDIKTSAFAKLFEKESPEAVRRVVDYHLKYSGVSRTVKFRTIYKEILKRELTESMFDGLCERFSQLVTQEVIEAPYVPGAHEFLKEHSSRYPCYVATGTPQSEAESIIKQRGMDLYFKKIFGSPTLKSESVKRVIESENAAPREVVYVGDALSDFEAASLHSVHFIARMTSVNAVLFEKISCIKLHDLKSLPAVVERL